ncbi:MAG: hypothetical protein AABX59_00765 [Nanoarchaeota archaeon]
MAQGRTLLEQAAGLGIALVLGALTIGGCRAYNYYKGMPDRSPYRMAGNTNIDLDRADIKLRDGKLTIEASTDDGNLVGYDQNGDGELDRLVYNLNGRWETVRRNEDPDTYRRLEEKLESGIEAGKAEGKFERFKGFR